LAVFLFFAGLVDFLFSIDSKVGRVTLGVMCFFGGAYILLTFLPHVRPNCPYRTPFSWDLLKYPLYLIPAIWKYLGRQCLKCIRPCMLGLTCIPLSYFPQPLTSTMSHVATILPDDIEMRALQWTAATVDDDDDIETLIEGIPGYLKFPTSRNTPSNIQNLLGVPHPDTVRIYLPLYRNFQFIWGRPPYH
jgi:hypothetical protein